MTSNMPHTAATTASDEKLHTRACGSTHGALRLLVQRVVPQREPREGPVRLERTFIAIHCVVITLFAICSFAVFTFFIINFPLTLFTLDPKGAGACLCKMSIITAFRTLISYKSVIAAVWDLLFGPAAIWREPVATGTS